MKFWKNPKYVSKFPILTVLLLESANVQQIYRMFSERTSAGQSIGGWICVWFALILWCWYYLVCVEWKNAKFAFWSTAVGVLINSLVIISVLYWR